MQSVSLKLISIFFFYLSAFKECTHLLLIMFSGNFFYVDSLVILNVGNINNIRNFIENKICYIIKHTCTIEYTYVLRNHVNMYTPLLYVIKCVLTLFLLFLNPSFK